jgi:hypothetical protein
VGVTHRRNWAKLALRKPAEVHDAILSAEVVAFSTIFLLGSPYSKSQGLQKFHS